MGKTDDEPNGSKGGGSQAETDSKPGGPVADWIERADAFWTRVETVLVVTVLVSEVLALCLWVLLKGLSSPSDAGSAGVVLRALIGAIAFGGGTHLLFKRQARRGKPAPEAVRRTVTSLMGIVGVAIAPLWANFGVAYASNWLNWFQQASFLTLLGGLRGVGTRLTLFLVLLGASLATARGKHITIDLIVRWVKPKVRRALVSAGWLTSCLVCFSLSWGFFDYIAIQNFGANADASRGQKFERVFEEIGEQRFIAARQLSLDLRSFPHLVAGTPYADWFKGKDYNAWLRSSGFVERYGEEDTRALELPPDQTRAPLVVIPGRGEPRGELIHTANLIFPVGLLILAFRFLVRALMVMLGRVDLEAESTEFSHTADEKLIQAGGDE